MIKRIIKILVVCTFSFILLAPNAYADKTLGDLKNELTKLKSEKAQNESSKKKTQAEINAQNNQIANAHAAVDEAEKDIEEAKIKIDESNIEIDKTKDESSKLLVFYEIMQGDSAFTQYITGATSMTDLMMRIDAVSQILKYNENKLVSLEKLIEDNKQLQIDLKKKEEELNQKIKNYEASLVSLKSDLSSLVEMSLDIDSQIKAQQELIKYYEAIGCKDDQALSKCVDIVNNASWLRPTNRGLVSSDFGYRSFILNGKPYSDFHNGVDVAGNSGGTPIYPTASGTVAAIIVKAKCGGNQVIIHTRVQGKDYTIHYAHMMDVYVKVGDQVTTQTVVGTVGGGGKTLKANGGWDTCSTGYHLHYNVATGFYLGNGYSSYSKYVANSFRAPNMPAHGKWYYSRY